MTTTYVYDVAGGLPVLLDDGTSKYIWGTNGLSYSVNKISGAVSVNHGDGLGSVRAITDSSGSVVRTYQTDEFGVPVAAGTQGSSTQPFGFTGEQRDPEDGLVYLRARMYGPTDGRFVQADALRKSAPGVLGWNHFSYAANNPIARVDPSGHSSSLVIVPCPVECGIGNLNLIESTPTLCLPVFDPSAATLSDLCEGPSLNPAERERGENEYTRQAKALCGNDTKCQCDYLEQQYAAQRGKEREKVKAAQKFLGCRRSRADRDSVETTLVVPDNAQIPTPVFGPYTPAWGQLV